MGYDGARRRRIHRFRLQQSRRVFNRRALQKCAFRGLAVALQQLFQLGPQCRIAARSSHRRAPFAFRQRVQFIEQFADPLVLLGSQSAPAPDLLHFRCRL